MAAALLVAGAGLMPMTSCEQFDDSELKQQITDINDRLTALETEMDTQLAALQAIVDGKTTILSCLLDEETGMYGVTYMDRTMLNGKIMINTDSEEVDKIFVGCAGGIDFKAHFAYDSGEVVAPASDMQILKIELKGLNGGHSGVDIHLGRANANLLMFRFLKFMTEGYDARLCSVCGGDARNAIPREAIAYIAVNRMDTEAVVAEAEQYQTLYRNEYSGIEDGICLNATVVENSMPMLSFSLQKRLVNAVVATPDGVERMMPGMTGIVETSSCLSIVESKEGDISVQILVRSVSASRKYNRISVLGSLYSLADAEVEIFGDYPGWMLSQSSPLLKIAKECYSKRFGNEPETKIMHAGLECGIFSSVYPGVDIISIGPDLSFPHSPDERVDSASVEKFWAFLCDILAGIPDKA